MTVERLTWYSVNGSVATPFSGGFRWRITNTEEDAILRNQTDIEVQVWASVSRNMTSYDLVTASSYYRLTSGGVTNTVNIKTRTDWRDVAANKTYYAGSSYPLKVMSGTAVAKFTVNHNADGTAPKCTMTIRWTTEGAGTFGDGISASAVLDIPTIPRATTPTVTPLDQSCGYPVYINLSSSASDSFRHTLSYRLGSRNGIIATKVAPINPDISTDDAHYPSYRWVIPAELAEEFYTTSSSKDLVIICDTYQDDTLIGTKTKTITVRLYSNNYAPVITVNETTNLEGNDRFLQGIDGVKLMFSVELKPGATSIKTAVMTIDGKSYTLQNPSGTANLTLQTSVISTAGSLPYRLTVTDNRGMEKSVGGNITFTAYSFPEISLEVMRSSENPAIVDITGSVSHALPFKCYIDYSVRRNSPSTWTTLLALDSTDNAVTILHSTELLSQAQIWEVRARVVDNQYSISTEFSRIVPAVVTYSEKKGGKAAAFFGRATDVPDNTLKVFGNIDAVNITAENITALEQSVTALESTIVPFGIQKILWDGAYYMHDGQTITLSEAVSEQPHGIVLIFSYYNSGAQNESFSSHFVPKEMVSLHPGKGHNFNLYGMWQNAVKYLYISDTSITGHEKNTGTRTVGGISLNNSYYVLRYVIGV